jgi:hypothetical protein
MFADVDRLHAERNHLEGCSYLDIIDFSSFRLFSGEEKTCRK